MGCGASVPKEPPHPAVDQPWACKDEATRVFHLVRASARTPHCTLAIDTHLFFRPQADLDGNGCLDADEFAVAMHLARESSNGRPVPTTLPANLIPPSKR